MEEKKKGKIGEITFLIIVMIIIGGFSGYFIGKEFYKKSVTTCKTNVSSSVGEKDVYNKYKNLSFVRTKYISTLYVKISIISSDNKKMVGDAIDISSMGVNEGTKGKDYTVSGIPTTPIKSVTTFNYDIDGGSDIAVLTKNGSLYLTVNNGKENAAYSIKFEKVITDKKIIDMAVSNDTLFVLTDDYKIYQIDKKDYSSSGKLGNLYEERETYLGKYTDLYYSVNAKTGLLKADDGMITYNNKKVYAKFIFSSMIAYNSSVYNEIFITNDNDVIYFKDEGKKIESKEFKLQKYTAKKFKSIKRDNNTDAIIITYKDGSTEKFENISESYNVD